MRVNRKANPSAPNQFRVVVPERRLGRDACALGDKVRVVVVIDHRRMGGGSLTGGNGARSPAERLSPCPLLGVGIPPPPAGAMGIPPPERALTGRPIPLRGLSIPPPHHRARRAAHGTRHRPDADAAPKEAQRFVLARERVGRGHSKSRHQSELGEIMCSIINAPKSRPLDSPHANQLCGPNAWAL